MFAFQPARHDPDTMHRAKLDSFLGLVHSLRWYAARTSLMLTMWATHTSIANEKAKRLSTQPVTENALETAEHAFMIAAVTEVRALLDRDPDTLAIGQIATGLKDVEAREKLHGFLDASRLPRVMKDRARRESYFDYIARYAEILSATDKASTVADHPLAAKARLVRYMAGRRIMHSTLHSFTLGGDDLDDVVQALLVVGSAIDAVMGDEACPDDLAAVESAGHRAAGQFLNTEVDAAPYTMNVIRSFLPEWVERGGEFPRWPDDFTEWGALWVVPTASPGDATPAAQDRTEPP